MKRKKDNKYQQVACDKCGQVFVIRSSNTKTIRQGELIVQYFYCTECGAKYQILTTDPTMRKLIAMRQSLPEGVTENKIIEQQQRLLPDLMRRGEEILNGEGESRKGVNIKNG